MSPAEDRPRLVAVPGSPEPAAPEAPAPGVGGAGRAPWVLSALLALALLISFVALVRQVQQTRGLEARVEDLSAALGGAEAEIEARRLHLDAVRGEVTRVGEALGALAELVTRDPAPAPPTRPPAVD